MGSGRPGGLVGMSGSEWDGRTEGSGRPDVGKRYADAVWTLGLSAFRPHKDAPGMKNNVVVGPACLFRSSPTST
ncbi:hypothetical protein H6P81_008570 [Aristolochia fimbriata]|uniref:Uncharacterized protein n=1 Tax=Aristolochia fimbriata TaxID=158543 RepID=A0AAV7EID8_ARIFI|nr:hypothetical protein H6P81_008570 [Aristolochia fimbriata]